MHGRSPGALSSSLVVGLVLASWLLLPGCSNAARSPNPAPATGGGAGAPVGSGGSPGAGGNGSAGTSGSGGAPGTGGQASRADGGASPLVSDAGPLVGPDGGDAGSPPPPPPLLAPSGCVTSIAPGKSVVPCGELTHDLSVPDSCARRRCGLILDVHGGTMSGAMEEKNTRLAEIGGKAGYIVIQPNAIVRITRNVLPQWVPDLDDVQVMRFTMDVVAAFDVDPERIHVTGFSQGGLMTWRLLCAHSDLFASAAPASGSLPNDPASDCTFTGTDRPAIERPILNLQGTLDTHSPFDQALIQRDAVRAAFEMDSGVQIEGDADYSLTRYTNPRGVVYEFLRHDYRTDAQYTFGPFHEELHGHCYPGSDDLTATLPGQFMGFACLPPTAFVWGERVLSFFEQHPKR